MRILKIWTLILSALPFWQCKTVEYTPASYEGRCITWGSGGGVSGHISCMALLDNGHYFTGQGLTEIAFERQGRLSRDLTDQLFKNYYFLQLNELRFNSPGNTYRFIEMNDAGKTHRIVWSSKKDLPNADAETMYTILKRQVEKDNQ